jgi:hypothetical protein
MLTLSEWLCEGIRRGADSTNLDYLVNGLLVFRLTAHKIISEYGSDAGLLWHHFTTLPPGMITNNTLGTNL